MVSILFQRVGTHCFSVVSNLLFTFVLFANVTSSLQESVSAKASVGTPSSSSVIEVFFAWKASINTKFILWQAQPIHVLQ